MTLTLQYNFNLSSASWRTKTNNRPLKQSPGSNAVGPESKRNSEPGVLVITQSLNSCPSFVNATTRWIAGRAFQVLLRKVHHACGSARNPTSWHTVSVAVPERCPYDDLLLIAELQINVNPRQIIEIAIASLSYYNYWCIKNLRTVLVPC